MSEFLISGADNICEIIGENKDNIGHLVAQEGLPAWKRSKKGPWKAHPDDLKKWAKEQAEKYRRKKDEKAA